MCRKLFVILSTRNVVMARAAPHPVDSLGIPFHPSSRSHWIMAEEDHARSARARSAS